jgi:hypothetical protein
LYTFSYILIVLGATMIVVAMIGCCGAMEGSKLFLGLYAFVLFVLLMFTLSSGIYVIYKKDGVRIESLRRVWKRSPNRNFWIDPLEVCSAGHGQPVLRSFNLKKAILTHWFIVYASALLTLSNPHSLRARFHLTLHLR